MKIYIILSHPQKYRICNSYLKIILELVKMRLMIQHFHLNLWMILFLRGRCCTIYDEKYLRKGKLLEYVDTIKACVLEMDKLLYK